MAVTARRLSCEVFLIAVTLCSFDPTESSRQNSPMPSLLQVSTTAPGSADPIGLDAVIVPLIPIPSHYQQALKKLLVHICNTNIYKVPDGSTHPLAEYFEFDRGPNIEEYLRGIKHAAMTLNRGCQFQDTSFVWVWIYINKMIRSRFDITYRIVHQLVAASWWITFKKQSECSMIEPDMFCEVAFGIGPIGIEIHSNLSRICQSAR